MFLLYFIHWRDGVGELVHQQVDWIVTVRPYNCTTVRLYRVLLLTCMVNCTMSTPMPQLCPVVQWSVHWSPSWTTQVLVLAGARRYAVEMCRKKKMWAPLLSLAKSIYLLLTVLPVIKCSPPSIDNLWVLNFFWNMQVKSLSLAQKFSESTFPATVYSCMNLSTYCLGY